MGIIERLRLLKEEEDENDEAKRRADESLRLLEQQLWVDTVPPQKRSIAQKLEDAKRECNERDQQRQIIAQSIQSEHPQKSKRSVSR